MRTDLCGHLIQFICHCWWHTDSNLWFPCPPQCMALHALERALFLSLYRITFNSICLVRRSVGRFSFTLCACPLFALIAFSFQLKAILMNGWNYQQWNVCSKWLYRIKRIPFCVLDEMNERTNFVYVVRSVTNMVSI